jgi:hypothetical protein
MSMSGHDTALELATAIQGALLIADAGMLWEDGDGELWEKAPTDDGWVNVAVQAERELPGETHWQLYDLALTALYITGELETAYGHETTGSDGVRRAPVRKVRGETVTP